MKLQIKDSGAWRNVISFTDEQQQAVEAAGIELMKAIDSPKVSMRIVRDDPSQTVEAILMKEKLWRWRAPGWQR